MRVQSLTDLKLRKLKADPRKRLDLWDARIPGFGVRVAPSGTKTFIVMYRLHEKKRRVSIGRYPEMSLSEAKQVALNMRAQVASGKDPVAKPASHIDDFASILKDFLKLHCERYNKPSTQRSTRRLLEKECLPHWGPRNITEITRKELITILDAIVARGSGGAANNAYAAISKFFNWCASRDLIAASPCIGVERPSKKNSRDRVLSDCPSSNIMAPDAI